MARARSSDAELARLIRASRLLDPTLKRAWLAALPTLVDEHRAELRAILLDADAARPRPAPTRPDPRA